MVWGGAEEQQKAQAEGNVNAKDWCDDVCQIIETAMYEGLLEWQSWLPSLLWSLHSAVTDQAALSTADIGETYMEDYHELLQLDIKESELVDEVIML